MTNLSMSMFANKADYWEARAKEAEAERDRYKEALERIVEQSAFDDKYSDKATTSELLEAQGFKDAAGIAKEALDA